MLIEDQVLTLARERARDGQGLGAQELRVLLALFDERPPRLTEVERVAREELRESIAAAREVDAYEHGAGRVVRTPEQAERLLAMLDRLS